MSQGSPTPTEAAIALLGDRYSARRRSAAKRLRKLKDPTAGPALLTALQKEVQDPRTWETQYHMIMALAECDYVPALPYLQSLAQQPFEATMVYVAIGDALVRLGRAYENDARPVLTVLQSGNDMLIDGGFRAVAMLRLTLDQPSVDQIVAYVSQRSLVDGLRFWVAAAAPGWGGLLVEQFLAACVASPRESLQQAARAAQQKKYLKWNPL